MHYVTIIALQKGYNVTAIQDQINSGICWHMEGSVGRFAMSMLQAGVCMLPLVRKTNAYGGTVPSRNDVKAGTTGSFEHCAKFWQKVHDGDFETIEALEETFGADIEEEQA
jgi:hypothetical protein